MNFPTIPSPTESKFKSTTPGMQLTLCVGAVHLGTVKPKNPIHKEKQKFALIFVTADGNSHTVEFGYTWDAEKGAFRKFLKSWSGRDSETPIQAPKCIGLLGMGNFVESGEGEKKFINLENIMGLSKPTPEQLALFPKEVYIRQSLKSRGTEFNLILMNGFAEKVLKPKTDDSLALAAAIENKAAQAPVAQPASIPANIPGFSTAPAASAPAASAPAAVSVPQAVPGMPVADDNLPF